MNISPIQLNPLQHEMVSATTGGLDEVGPTSFASMLDKSIGQVNELLTDADRKVPIWLSGKVKVFTMR